LRYSGFVSDDVITSSLHSLIAKSSFENRSVCGKVTGN